MSRKKKPASSSRKTTPGSSKASSRKNSPSPRKSALLSHEPMPEPVQVIVDPAQPEEEEPWRTPNEEEIIAVVIFIVISFTINIASHNEFIRGFRVYFEVYIGERLLG
ncbi:hypothetical protein FOCG_14363 [Fusarium oxysporum f. sp. radicis-lycopersici 26381]|uniref:Uncharacterized protein n=1 Tax=Fusarium oxysporum Fo47 TaxID=660027 RepID=W9LAY7_FUSOX|nr:uncharacterized protein FOBCDRAFT_255018 [Fusarium oxysporum Fo47]EWZ52174.1 hypothetical protein FOZG_01976 [Fusarium oxysporum Fo47]EXL44212.1 hypothetical protein FOCG_14363 [Fusarium oxysporum f. sp. radicis-lycopersici 26381]QKD46755.1 hypothetical protein FOBCDRAFT_255018 [Fusarium oxysporum Fo47]